MFRYQSKLKFGLICLGASFIAACIKMIWATFPIVEFYGIVGIVYGGYVSSKAVTDIKESKYSNGNTETK